MPGERTPSPGQWRPFAHYTLTVFTLSSVQRCSVLACALAFLTNMTPHALGQADDVDVEIVIRTLKARMRYDVEKFTVEPGQRVKLTLENADDMPHNLVLCVMGEESGQQVGEVALTMGALGVERGWVPEDPRILAAIGQTPPKAAASIIFEAPEEEGAYPYVCTFPGHAPFMKGVMHVGVPDTSLRDLTYAVYEGRWNRLPNFSRMTPTRTGAQLDGVLRLETNGTRDAFGVVYKGTLAIEKAGLYRFDLGSDDGSRLLVDGRVAVNHDGAHGFVFKKGAINLPAGNVDFELQYFENGGDEALALQWSGPGFGWEYLSDPDATPQSASVVGIPLEPANGEAVIYRNFIEGAGVRAIGVGYPGNVNLAFDANRCRLAMIWLGGFMDGAKHWSGRGQGFQGPLGYGVIALPEAQGVTPATDAAAWPQPAVRAQGVQFLGYDLDASRRPTFRYRTANGVTVDDQVIPSEGATPTLVRSLKLSGEGSIHYLAARGAIKNLDDGRVAVTDANLIISIDAPGAQVSVREIDNQPALVVTAAAGTTIQQTYEWDF